MPGGVQCSRCGSHEGRARGENVYELQHVAAHGDAASLRIAQVRLVAVHQMQSIQRPDRLQHAHHTGRQTERRADMTWRIIVSDTAIVLHPGQCCPGWCVTEMDGVDQHDLTRDPRRFGIPLVKIYSYCEPLGMKKYRWDFNCNWAGGWCYGSTYVYENWGEVMEAVREHLNGHAS
jgi:hypothetical protein